MSPEKPDLAAWLDQNVNWMVAETAQYFENRERLALCQTVATMLLTQALNRICEGREESLRQALAESQAAQAELLAKLAGGKRAGKNAG
ncbi:MAG: hypothetical protein ACOZHQ_13425 [Thermodesulfobacteriota bacterium]